MSTPADRIREACDQAEAARNVGRSPNPNTHFYAPVLAGDVVEVVTGLGDKAAATAKALAAGAAAVAPETVVYQRADQLRAVLDLTAVPAPEAAPVDADTRRKFNPAGK